MDMLINILITVVPFLAVIILIIPIQRLNEFIKNSEVRKFEFRGSISLKRLLPKEMEKELVKQKVADEEIKEFISKYISVLYMLSVYVIILILYVIYTVYRFISLVKFNEYYTNMTINQISANWALVFFNIMIIGMFILEPILGFSRYKKSIKIIDSINKFIKNMIIKINNTIRDNLINVSILFINVLTISILTVDIWYKLLNYLRIPVTFFTILPILYFYRYTVTKIIGKAFLMILKKVFKNVKFYEDIILLSIENYIYLSLVIIYSYGVYIGESNSDFVIAVSILFLIDTYKKQLHEINNMKRSREDNNN